MTAVFGGSGYTLATAPLLSWLAIAALGALALLVLAPGVWRRARGILWRGLAAYSLRIICRRAVWVLFRSTARAWVV